MPTSLIINADDLGFSPAVTDGILHAHRVGILTSATLMTTMPAPKTPPPARSRL